MAIYFDVAKMYSGRSLMRGRAGRAIDDFFLDSRPPYAHTPDTDSLMAAIARAIYSQDAMRLRTPSRPPRPLPIRNFNGEHTMA